METKLIGFRTPTEDPKKLMNTKSNDIYIRIKTENIKTINPLHIHINHVLMKPNFSKTTTTKLVRSMALFYKYL